MKFCFGDIVVVDKNAIGVVVKCWCRSAKDKEPTYDVYVSIANRIIIYSESEMQRYMVRHKRLNDEELEYQHNAVCGL